MIRKLLIVFGLWVTYTQASIFIESIYPTQEEEIIVETAESTTATTTIEIPEPVVEKPWEPYKFNKKVGILVTKHGGRLIKIKGNKKYSFFKRAFGFEPKEGVIVDGDLYFRHKRQNYVIHKGKLIKI